MCISGNSLGISRKSCAQWLVHKFGTCEQSLFTENVHNFYEQEPMHNAQGLVHNFHPVTDGN